MCLRGQSGHAKGSRPGGWSHSESCPLWGRDAGRWGGHALWGMAGPKVETRPPWSNCPSLSPHTPWLPRSLRCLSRGYTQPERGRGRRHFLSPCPVWPFFQALLPSVSPPLTRLQMLPPLNFPRPKSAPHPQSHEWSFGGGVLLSPAL